MNKLKQTAKTILIFILCSATCFLSIGCGEDITVEDGEYTAELVADPLEISSIYWFRDFSVIINNNEITIDGENYGTLSSRKISEDNYKMGYHYYNNFDVSQLKSETKVLATSKTNKVNYLVIDNNGKYYLASISLYDNNFKITVIWELKKTT